MNNIETIYKTLEILWTTFGKTNSDIDEQLYDFMLEVEAILDFGSNDPLNDALEILNEANELIKSVK